MKKECRLRKQSPAPGRLLLPVLFSAIVFFIFLITSAIIVLIKKGDQVLLVHARNFKGNFDSLVAGFVETGESLEEAVHREVMEETGLTIRNVKYFSSQPWPYPSGLMVGYTAEYVDGEIHLQKEELSRGKWFSKDNLPILPEKLSIARRLIDAWLEGKI